MSGEKGKRIRELTSVVLMRFKFSEKGVEMYADKVNNRSLCAIAQAVPEVQASRWDCRSKLSNGKMAAVMRKQRRELTAMAKKAWVALLTAA